MKPFSLPLTALTLVYGLFATSVVAWDSYPDQTDDGLDRIKSKSADAVYWKEGASLSGYNRIRLDDAEVSFKKNWLRDQNRDRRSLNSRVTSEDMDDIREALAKLFREVFTAELEKGGYEVVNVSGADVLLLQPSIVDLDVTAPDVSASQAGRVRTYTTSAGEMTLHLDFRDSETNALMGRAIDRRKDHAVGNIQYSSKVTNQADARRMLGSWAKSLRKALDDAHQSETKNQALKSAD